MSFFKWLFGFGSSVKRDTDFLGRKRTTVKHYGSGTKKTYTKKIFGSGSNVKVQRRDGNIERGTQRDSFFGGKNSLFGARISSTRDSYGTTRNSRTTSGIFTTTKTTTVSGNCFRCEGTGKVHFECRNCDGTGTFMLKCRKCDGSGRFKLPQKDCFKCNGKGCQRCGGTGILKPAVDVECR